MTPEEKANDLIQIFSKLDKGLSSSRWLNVNIVYDCFHIKCALIFANEILEKSPNNYPIKIINYWTKVKYELNKYYKELK
jgi:hypothetical protein